MKALNLDRFAVSSFVAAAMLAGCGGTQPPIGAPGVISRAAAPSARANGENYKIMYKFTGSPDGSDPEASMIVVGGTLYGTTAGGGSYTSYCRQYYSLGCGTVFSITTDGTEKVLHTFNQTGDGSNPYAALIYVKGTLYATTTYGGASGCGQYDVGCGTVFSITPNGAENILYKFDRSNGSWPRAPLINLKGTLYGTTYAGGANLCEQHNSGQGCGTVFSVTTGGAENVLHSFSFGRDGPTAGLIDVHGTLYGTTKGYFGEQRLKQGTVFSIAPGGTEKVLHRFGKGTDGAHPAASLIDVNGTLYGTTFQGGTYGGGTVFSITLDGAEKVLHSFGHLSDGAHPDAPLIDVSGRLYGTTVQGGTCKVRSSGGCGTVFSITTSGTEKVLYRFAGFGDGMNPAAGLTDVNGVLYGTTRTGGNCCGIVFALKP